MCVRQERPPLNASWPALAKDLMSACWGSDPKKRLTMKQVRVASLHASAAG